MGYPSHHFAKEHFILGRESIRYSVQDEGEENFKVVLFANDDKAISCFLLLILINNLRNDILIGQKKTKLPNSEIESFNFLMTIDFMDTEIVFPKDP